MKVGGHFKLFAKDEFYAKKVIKMAIRGRGLQI